MRTRRSQKRSYQEHIKECETPGEDGKENIKPDSPAKKSSPAPQLEECKVEEVSKSSQPVPKKESEEPEETNSEINEKEDHVHPSGIGLAETNVVYMEAGPKPSTVQFVEGAKEVIDISQGYVELAPVYNNHNGGDVTGSECIYNANSNYTLHVLPANSEGDQQNLVTYTWNPATTSAVSTPSNTSAEVGSGSGSRTPSLSSTHGPWTANTPRRAIFATTVQAARPHGNPQTALILTSTPMSSSRVVSTEEAAGDAYRRESSFAGNRRSVSVGTVSLGEALKERQYTPSQASRQSHNEKERRRRSRMKQSCEMLRNLVPGVTEKTDKATVLEHTVKYLIHLQRCGSLKCDHTISGINAAHLQKVQYVATTVRYETAAPQAAPQAASNARQVEEQPQYYQVEVPEEKAVAREVSERATEVTEAADQSPVNPAVKQN